MRPAQCFARLAAIGQAPLRLCRLPPNRALDRRGSRSRCALRCALPATNGLTRYSSRIGFANRLNRNVRPTRKGRVSVFGLCTSTAVQREFRPMLCKAGSSRQGSIETVPVATKPGLGSSGYSHPFSLAVRLPCHQSPNTQFKPDCLRQPV